MGQTALALIIFALTLIGISLPMAPFHSAPGGEYLLFEAFEGNFEAYALAREQALTLKFKLQDYGITLLLFAVALASFRWHTFKAPRSRFGFVALAFSASVLTSCALVFDLLQRHMRWEYPPWADSLGIPLMAVPALLTVGMVWAFGHLILLKGITLRLKIPLSLNAIRQDDPWLLTISTLTVLLLFGFTLAGAYWYAAPSTIWLYFYASIAAVRYAGNDG